MSLREDKAELMSKLFVLEKEKSTIELKLKYVEGQQKAQSAALKNLQGQLKDTEALLALATQNKVSLDSVSRIEFSLSLFFSATSVILRLIYCLFVLSREDLNDAQIDIIANLTTLAITCLISEILCMATGKNKRSLGKLTREIYICTQLINIPNLSYFIVLCISYKTENLLCQRTKIAA